MIHFKDTQYGFEWGSAKLVRGFSDSSKGWVTFILRTPKTESGIQIYVTKSGKVRIHGTDGEWTPPVSKSATDYGRTSTQRK